MVKVEINLLTYLLWTDVASKTNEYDQEMPQ